MELKVLKSLKTTKWYGFLRPVHKLVAVWPGFFLKVGLRQLLLETALLLFVITLLSLDENLSFATFRQGFIFTIIICAVYQSLRLRRPTGNRRQKLLVEGRAALLLISLIYTFWLVTCLISLGRGFALTNYAYSDFQSYALLTLLSANIVYALFFSFYRAAISIWLWMSNQGRRYLRWSLTVAHLKLILGLTITVLAIYFGVFWVNLLVTPGVNTGDALVAFFFTSFSFLLLGGLMAALVLVIVMPIFAVFSYFVTRRMVSRLETLVQATATLRNGDYSIRVPVSGQDEIAQLQTDFNTMACKLEQTLTALQAERDTGRGLLRTNRELVASVSHELRTPVAALRGYLEPLLEQRDTIPPPTLWHDLTIMEREVLQLQSLIEDLFDLSRASVNQLTLHCQPGDPTALIERLVEKSAPLAWQSGRVEVVTALPPELPLARLDESRLEQVLSNLVYNGIRHTPPGGIVVVGGLVEPDWLRLEVRDTGEGIETEALPHIWERFYRAPLSRDKNVGTGLGLAIVKEFTEAMGGTVAVESQAGQGSCFIIRLRLAGPEEIQL